MKYELMVILSPKQTDKEIEKNLKEVKGILTENGFTVVDEDLWGMREMAYPIKGNRKAYYAVLNFEGEPEGLPTIQKDLNLQAGVIRFMASKVPDDYTLLRYDQLATTGKSAKLSSPAEELSKKVGGQGRNETRSEKPRSKTRSAGDKEATQGAETPAESAETSTEKLDESLKAIIEDKDL
ncbi:MAG: 30S ribosomal protein S6 [Candidatus Gracilibacteria bacterium]|jgi:small subunit ribosomal protein S6